MTLLHSTCQNKPCTPLSPKIMINFHNNFAMLFNPRRACAARVTGLSVCLSVCPFVKPHLTSGAFVRAEINVTYSTGNEGEKNLGFSLKPPGYGDPLPSLYGQPTVRWYHSLGIGFSRYIKGQSLPVIRINMTQRPTFLFQRPSSTSNFSYTSRYT